MSGPADKEMNCDEIAEAAKGAERLISRIEDKVMHQLEPEGDPEEGFGEVIEELDTAPEIKQLREAVEQNSREHLRATPSDRSPEYDTWRTGP